MTLRSRLMLLVILVLAAALAVGSFFAYWHVKDKVATELGAAIGAGSRLAAIAVNETTPVWEAKGRLEQLVMRFNGDRHVRAYLTDVDGKVLLTSKVAEVDEPAPALIVRMITGSIKRVVVPLPIALRDFGNLHLEADPSNEIAEAWEDLRLYLTILVAFSAVVLTLLHAVLGRALSPLHQLTAAFARVGAGDLSQQVRLSGSRELVALGADFNGMVMRLHEAEINNRRLTEQLEQVQEEDRTELARNLHDEVSPLLFSVDVDATTIGQLAGQPPADSVRIGERADAIKEAIGELKRNVRAILGQLRPTSAGEVDLKRSVDLLLEFWRGRHPGVTFSAVVPKKSWDPDIERAVHSVIRESLGNALKHGAPRQVSIEVADQPGYVEVCVANDGLPMCSSSNGGYGILGMQERVARIGGTLAASDRPEGGVAVVARLPHRDPRDEPIYSEAAQECQPR